MIFICCLLVLALVAQAYFNWREREKLIRRVQSPQQVIIEEAKPHKRPERVFTDAQYKKLQEDRGQIARDN